MGRRLLLLVVLVCVLPTAVGALEIRSDNLWVQGPQCVDGWSNADFDDSHWKEVIYPNILMWHRDWPLDAAARPMWGDAFTSCVRRHFHLDEIPKEATAEVWVDDDYELYINGTFVGRSKDGWGEMPGETYDVAKLLREGDNVIAMLLMNMVGEHSGALFALTVPGAADEPRTWQSVIKPLRQTALAIGFVLGAVLFVLLVRGLSVRLAPHTGRLSPMVIGAAAIALAVTAQWYLQTVEIYKFILGQPVTDWSWPALAGAVVLLSLLSITLRGQPVSDLVGQAPPGAGWVLLGILGLGAYLRIVNVDTVPSGFFQDEAINGLDSIRLYRIPDYELWSDSIGGRPTLFLYAVGAVLEVFGISYANLKIVPVAVGVASIAGVYLVGRRAIGPRAALWAAFLFAVSRWHIHFSRMAWEVNCVTLFSTLGFALLLAGLERPRRSILMLTTAALMLAAGLYTYAAYRAVGGVVAVFLVATLMSSDRRVLFDKFWGLLLGGIASLVLLFPLAQFAVNNPVLYWARYADVSLTAYMRYHSTVVPWLHQIGKALLSFNQRGDLDPLPYFDPASGMLLLLGVASAAPIAYRRGFRLLLCWLLAFAALASLTKDSPHATRMLGMLPPATLLAGYGGFRLFDLLRSMRLPSVVRVSAVAALVAVAIAVNNYRFFGSQQQAPEIDLVMNEGARRLCSELLERGGSVFWTDEVAYNCKPQCMFLFSARNLPQPTIITLDDLLRTEQMKLAARPVTVIINNTTLERAGAQIPLDANGDPILDLPARPLVMQTREGKASYYIFRF